MNRAFSAVLAVVIISMLAGCATSNQYIISTRNGRMEVASSRPQAVPGTDLYVYWDQGGNLHALKQSDLAQVMAR